MPAHSDLEWELHQRGYRAIAGVDEVGRGCWAGPVVAAAVVLSDVVLRMPGMLAGINDSKQLSAMQRELHYTTIQRLAVGIGIGMVSAHDIDMMGILNATKCAMQQALLALPLIPDYVLIDAVTLTHWPTPQRAIIHGDTISLSIAAASIVAKVTRDRMIGALDRVFPAYGFANHKGYGTAQHQDALQRHGVLPVHRRSFRPMTELQHEQSPEKNV